MSDLREKLLADWRVTTLHHPIPGESADGYVARVAAAEFIPRMFDITRMAGVNFAHRSALAYQNAAGVRVVADCLRIDADDLAGRCVRDAADLRRVAFFGISLDHQHVAANTRRYSPASLRISRHHRALWKLRAFPFCEETWQLLTDCCPNPNCAAVQRWQRTGGIEHCDQCGEPLYRAVVRDVPAHLRDKLSLAVGLVHPDPTRRTAAVAALPDAIARIGPSALLDLLCAVAGVVDPGIRYSAGKRLISHGASALSVATAVAEAWTIVAGWPSAFESLAAARLATRSGRFGDGNDDATVDFLALPWRCRLDPLVADAIRKLADRLTGNGPRGYSPREAASRSGLAVTALVSARRDGRIPTIFHWVDGRPVPLLERRAIDALCDEARIQHHRAAAQLGVTSRAIEELVQLGILVSAGAAPGKSGNAVTRFSIDALRCRIQMGASSAAVNWISLHAAMRAAGGRLKPWARAIQALNNGSLAYGLTDGTQSLTRRITVSRETVAALVALPDVPADPAQPYEPLMSKADAADALNLLPKSYTFMNEWPSSNGWSPTVPLDWVECMARLHISAPEIAMRLSIKSDSIRALMRENGVRRLSDAGYDRPMYDVVFADLAGPASNSISY